jgi:hypothetical protein
MKKRSSITNVLKVLSIPLLASAFVAPGGCSDGADNPVSGAAPEIVSRPIFGGQTYEDCSPSEVVQINAAVGVLLQAGTSGFPALQTCLTNAALVENTCHTGPQIAEYLRQDDVTHILCSDLGCYVDATGTTLCTLAEAPVRISGEQLTLDRSFVAGFGAQMIASVMAHELMHNRGFRHVENPFGSTLYPNTVPQQMAACILNGVANPWAGAGTAPPQCTHNPCSSSQKCCDPDPNGGCLRCIGRNLECP